MNELEIDVSEVEELQTIKNLSGLNAIFTKAKSLVVQGGTVILTRKNADGTSYKFDEISTEADLEDYKEKVFKYL